MKDALIFHTGRNFNGSNVTQEAAERAMQDLAYVPVLANFCEIDGVRDFTTHDFEFDDDGNIIYYEKQIGCITADPAYMEDDAKVEGRKNVFARVSIPRVYTDAADIIERKGGTDVSVELLINDMSYSKTEGLLFNDITVIGLTCLGTNPETGRKVDPGMENAHISLEDFSKENNSIVFNKSELIEEITQAVMDKLDDHIAEYSAKNNHGKEENTLEIFENEVTAGENEPTEETPEVVEDFDGEDGGTTDNTGGTVGAGGTEGTGGTGGNGTEGTGGTSGTGSTEGDEPEEGSNEAENQHGDLNNGQNGKAKSFVKQFELSHSDIRCGLYALLAPFEEADNEWYYISDVYDDHFVYEGWLDSNHLYDQKYTRNGDEIAFDGERVHMNKVIVTDSEYAQLNEMRSNYSAVVEKLAKYEAEPEKMSILNSAEYMNIADQKDFEELKKQENHFDLSIDELKTQADAMLLQFAKSGHLNFSKIEKANEEPEQKRDFFAFARVEKNSSFLDGLLKR